ncbi:MAG: SEC-C domain-containing protein [Candidatus Aminicenantes bacterium]|nr:SEC-C domain-containing protein [Candidatus Aminicenantes bacterium]
MEEAYEKALCPCGSGKRYVECCLNRHIEKSRENPLQNSKEELKKIMARKDFSSLEAANEFLRVYWTRRNSEPRADFLGLSSDQIHRLIDLPFTHTSDIVRFNADYETEILTEIPIVKDVRRFLDAFAGAEPLKATATGNLPREFAKALFEELDRSRLKKYIKFRTETDSLDVHTLRLVLEIVGWVRKSKGYFRLTQKGRKALDVGLSASNYLDLLSSYICRFNWGYQDRYPEFEIIQRAALFSLYLLHKKARQSVASHSLSPYFIRAFPRILAEVQSPWKNIFSIIDDCFALRFIERFCGYFGLIDVQERSDPLGHIRILQVNGFFDRLMTWKTEVPSRLLVH